MMVEKEELPSSVIPGDAKLVQLRQRRKQPLAEKGGKVVALLPSDFKPLPGHNVGIHLDGKFLVVDVDDPKHPELATWVKKLPKTWEQTTPKGRHLLYRVPADYEGTNLDKSSIGFGDVKTKGYIVAPGCSVDDAGPGHPAGVYRIVDSRDPVAAPEWLLDRARARVLGIGALSDTLPERDTVEDGTRDDTLIALGGAMRRQGFTEDAIRAMLGAIVDSGVVEQPPGREITSHDVERLARSAASWQTGPLYADKLLFKPAGWVTGATVPQHRERVEWILPGFIPAVGLSIVYGDGKIGKSSWASWLAAHVTRMGRTVIFIPSGEETFELFVMRARLNGAVDELLVCWPSSVDFRIPKAVTALELAATTYGNVGMVYIDALYSHFSDTPGFHAGERARSNLQSLAEFAINNRTSVVGTIHENASGGLLGSREMRNVCRSLIHATRKKDDDLIIRSDGANGYSCDYGIRFPGVAVPDLDGNGNPLVFVDAYGDVVEQAMWVLNMGDKVGPPTVDPSTLQVNSDDLIADYVKENPNATKPDIAKALGIGTTSVQRWRAKQK